MNGPRIAVVFNQTADLGIHQETVIPSLQAYVDLWLTPEWGVTAELYQAANVTDGEWALIFADNSDQAQALGYHDLEGTAPRGYCFVQSSDQANEPVSVTASHELAEMLLDPACNLGAYTPRGRWIAREICDPVQGTTVSVNGIPMANFVLPSWYGAGATPFDAAQACTQPWEIVQGGYVPVWDGQNWSPLFGSDDAAFNYRRAGKAGRLRRGGRRNRRPTEKTARSILA
jgi:hypothetical protein